jgi:hypothetical protein
MSRGGVILKSEMRAIHERVHQKFPIARLLHSLHPWFRPSARQSWDFLLHLLLDEIPVWAALFIHDRALCIKALRIVWHEPAFHGRAALFRRSADPECGGRRAARCMAPALTPGSRRCRYPTKAHSGARSAAVAGWRSDFGQDVMVLREQTGT